MNGNKQILGAVTSELSLILQSHANLFSSLKLTEDIAISIVKMIGEYQVSLLGYIQNNAPANIQPQIETFLNTQVNILLQKYRGEKYSDNPSVQTDLLIEQGKPFLNELDYVTLILVALYIQNLCTKSTLTGEISISSITLDFINSDSEHALQDNSDLPALINQIVSKNLNLQNIKLKLEIALTIFKREIDSQQLELLQKAGGEAMNLGIGNAREFINKNGLEQILISLSDEIVVSLLNLVNELCAEMLNTNKLNLNLFSRGDIDYDTFRQNIYGFADLIKERFKGRVMELIITEDSLSETKLEDNNLEKLSEFFYQFFEMKVFKPVSDLATNETNVQVNDLYGKLIHMHIAILVLVHWNSGLG